MCERNKPYVVFIGSSGIDSYYTLDQWPNLGDKANCRHGKDVPGGLTANAACVCAGFGVKTYAFDFRSSDPKIDFLFEDLENYHVDTSMIQRLPEPDNGQCFIFQVPNGERVIFVVAGERIKHTLTQEQLDFLKNAEFVYGTPGFFQRFADYIGLLRFLKENGVKLMFDAEASFYDEGDWREQFQYASILSFNEFAVDCYRGQLTPEQFFRELFGMGVETILLTLGADGVRMLTKDDDYSVPAYPLQVVDATGAGDTLNASFVAGLMLGYEKRKALRFANGAANRAVTIQGPRGGVADVGTVEKFMAAHGGSL